MPPLKFADETSRPTREELEKLLDELVGYTDVLAIYDGYGNCCEVAAKNAARIRKTILDTCC